MICHRATRLLVAGLVLLTSSLALHGQDDPDAGLIQALLESEDEKAFQAAVTAARKGGISEQGILEARFLFLIDLGDFARVAALAPEMEKRKAAFRIEESVIFSVPEEFFGIVEYCQALAALEKGDEDGFKKHIQEAFWNSPRQAAAFAPHIEQLRLERAMARIKIDFTQPFAQQKDGKPVTLAALTDKSNHLVVHFWSPWSAECEENLPDFLAMTRELAHNGIPVVSVLIEESAEALGLAREFRAGIKAKESGDWIVDNSKASLTRKLRVLDLPTVVLLKRDGSVAFNGHPSEDGLWSALAKIAPKIKRPHVQPGE